MFWIQSSKVWIKHVFQRFVHVTFHVFNCTILVIHGPVACGERFPVNVNQVAILDTVVRVVMLCVQNFVRSPHFTSINIFTESGVSKLYHKRHVCSVESFRVWILSSDHSWFKLFGIKLAFDDVLQMTPANDGIMVSILEAKHQRGRG